MTVRERLLQDLEILPESDLRVVERFLEALSRQRLASESEDVELAERGIAEYAEELRREDVR
jgi:hypothetical protein